MSPDGKGQFNKFYSMNLDERRQFYKKLAKEINTGYFVLLFMGVLFYLSGIPRDIPLVMFGFLLIVIVWHLLGVAGLTLWAQYKGQSRAWSLFMLLSLPGYVIAAIVLYTLPDKYYETERKNSNLAATSEIPRNPQQVSGAPPQSVVSNQGASQARFCPSCGARMPDAARFCQSCGKDVGVQMCRACGMKVPQGALFCGNCGKKIASAIAPSAGLEDAG